MHAYGERTAECHTHAQRIVEVSRLGISYMTEAWDNANAGDKVVTEVLSIVTPKPNASKDIVNSIRQALGGMQ